MALSQGFKRVLGRRMASVHSFTIRRMASSTAVPFLLSPQELKDISASNPNVVTLDVSWFMPGSPRKPDEEFAQKRLPVNARRFDLDEVASSHPLGLKHMMPSASQFAGACGEYLVILLCCLLGVRLRSARRKYFIITHSCGVLLQR